MSEPILPETEVDLQKKKPPTSTPPLSIDHVEMDTPRTAVEAFDLIAVRSAEVMAALREKQLKDGDVPEKAVESWAFCSGVFKALAAFSAPCSYASARHVLWAYDVICRRMPSQRQANMPMLMWLRMVKVPACATDKAMPAVLLFYHLAQMAVVHASSLPQAKRGKPSPLETGAAAAALWYYENAEGLTVTLSNEDAYQLQKDRVYWRQYSDTLLFAIGVMLREICNVAEPDAPRAQENPAAGGPPPATPQEMPDTPAAPETTLGPELAPAPSSESSS